MLEKVAFVMVIVLFVGGCTGGLLKIRQSEEQPGLESPQELKAILTDVLEGATERAKETQWYRTGEGIATGVLSILATLGIGGFAVERKSRKEIEIQRDTVTSQKETISRKAMSIALGLREIEQAIMEAGKEGKTVTGKIKTKGPDSVSTVDKARREAGDMIVW